MERKYPTPRPVAVDFFCGAGGMSLGFEQAGFDIVLGIDIDGHHVATHERNFPYGKSLCASIVDLNGRKIRELLGNEDDIDAVIGGPPCQGFSNMGLRDLKDPRNSLIDHYLRMILELRPKTFVMENVPGMLAGETRMILDRFVQLSNENGYRVTLPVQVLDAAEFGVPQRRKRLFVLGVREDVGGAACYPWGKCHGQPSRPTVLQAIADLPTVERYEELFRNNNAPYSKKPKNDYASVARGLSHDPSDLSRPRIWNEETCSGCLRVRHDDNSIRLYAATEPGSTVPGHKLPRLDPKGLCPTLRAGSDSTHGSYTAPRPIHPLLPRCITSREAARLHGYPDWFAFYPLKWHAYRQIGNSVCPPVARAIGYALREVLQGKVTRTKPAPIRLGDTFVLPKDRPRTLKRVAQVKQYPPVIAHLFSKAYDVRKQKLNRAEFTFADVQEAIEVTGVNLSWVRAETFLTEIARSRRLEDFLRPVRSQGYTIVPMATGKTIGKFVPLGTAGALGERETVTIRMGDIRDPEILPLKSFDLNGNGWGVVAVLSQEALQRKLWKSSKCVVALARKAAVCPAENAGFFELELRKPPKFKPIHRAVLTCKPENLPNIPRLATICKSRNLDRLTLLVAATNKHLLAVEFAECLTVPKEAARASFTVTDN